MIPLTILLILSLILSYPRHPLFPFFCLIFLLLLLAPVFLLLTSLLPIYKPSQRNIFPLHVLFLTLPHQRLSPSLPPRPRPPTLLSYPLPPTSSTPPSPSTPFLSTISLFLMNTLSQATMPHKIQVLPSPPLPFPHNLLPTPYFNNTTILHQISNPTKLKQNLLMSILPTFMVPAPPNLPHTTTIIYLPLTTTVSLRLPHTPHLQIIYPTRPVFTIITNLLKLKNFSSNKNIHILTNLPSTPYATCQKPMLSN